MVHKHTFKKKQIDLIFYLKKLKNLFIFFLDHLTKIKIFIEKKFYKKTLLLSAYGSRDMQDPITKYKILKFLSFFVANILENNLKLIFLINYLLF